MVSPFMTKYKVVLVPFPFDDLSDAKVRPSICLTNSIGPFNHIIIAFISSKIPDTLLSTDLLISKSENGFALTGLTIDSVIRLHKMVTIPKSLIKRELGSIDEDLVLKVRTRLSALFD